MYKWENQSKDCVCTSGNIDSKIYKNLYGSDLDWYASRKPTVINSKPEDSFTMYNVLHDFTLELINKSSGILRDGLIKRLLRSEDVGLLIDGGDCTITICIGKQKKKIKNINSMFNDIYVAAENLVQKELSKVYIELGYQYISDYAYTDKLGLRYMGTEDIEGGGLRLCPVELEPGLYDVNKKVLELLIDQEKGEKIYRTTAKWQGYNGKGDINGLIGVLKDLSTAFSGTSVGNRLIMKEVNGEIEFIDERQLYVEGKAPEVKWRVAQSVVNSIVSNLLNRLGSFEAIHSIKWDRKHLGENTSLWCESCEKGAIDLWIR